MRNRTLHTALALLSASRTRFAMTVVGMSLSVLLMVFLTGIYRGVSDGSVEFIRGSEADVWVLQEGSTNILRSFSILTKAHGSLLEELPGVRSVAPVLFRLTTVQARGGTPTTYLTGFSPRSAAGGPPALLRGRTVRNRGEIVLDRSFAARWACQVGDTVIIMDRSFVVTGISGGSNMFVIQYAFVHIDDVRTLYGVNDIVSTYLVLTVPGADPTSIASTISAEVPGTAAYDRGTFLAQNIAEMETGFLPILLVMMAMSASLLTIILGLLLTMNVLEHREEFAVLKALGSPRHFLPSVVFAQSFQLVAISSVVAVLLLVPTALIVASFAPEVSISFSAADIIRLGLILFLLFMSGALFPLVRVRGIYPTEAFR